MYKRQLRARLAAIPDLDLQAGLRLVSGKLERCRRILKLFADGHGEDVPRLSALIGQNDLAELMGGTAGADSTPGQGSTFWFTARLQRAQDLQPRPESAVTDAEQQLRSRPQRARLLLAEDNAVNREVALDLLHDVGLAVDVAEDGVEALDLARQHRYELVLMLSLIHI